MKFKIDLQTASAQKPLLILIKIKERKHAMFAGNYVM